MEISEVFWRLSFGSGGSSPKILGGGGHCPISPFITESILSVLRNRKIRSPYIDLHFPASF